MTENMLISIDEDSLEDVNGGLSFGISVNDKTLAGASLNLGDGSIGGSVTVLGHTFSALLGLKITL